VCVCVPGCMRLQPPVPVCIARCLYIHHFSTNNPLVEYSLTPVGLFPVPRTPRPGMWRTRSPPSYGHVPAQPTPSPDSLLALQGPSSRMPYAMLIFLPSLPPVFFFVLWFVLCRTFFVVELSTHFISFPNIYRVVFIF